MKKIFIYLIVFSSIIGSSLAQSEDSDYYRDKERYREDYPIRTLPIDEDGADNKYKEPDYPPRYDYNQNNRRPEDRQERRQERRQENRQERRQERRADNLQDNEYKGDNNIDDRFLSSDIRNNMIDRTIDRKVKKEAASDNLSYSDLPAINVKKNNGQREDVLHDFRYLPPKILNRIEERRRIISNLTNEEKEELRMARQRFKDAFKRITGVNYNMSNNNTQYD